MAVSWGGQQIFRFTWTAASFCGALCLTGPSLACEWQPNVWHHICTDSPFFERDLETLPGAALLQEDGRFARLVLGSDAQGALVSVNLPGTTAAENLTSTLVMPAGNIMTRTVSGEQLDAVVGPEPETITYSFRVDPADITLFQDALRWRVAANGNVTTLTLKGSRIAIDAALQARSWRASAAE